jgi:glycosyltransferase involved in cell wall biosynthesis
MHKNMITIMTPTYNRAYILPKLYKSLCEQTLFNFEWLVIDDGSTDDTAELVQHWIKTTSSFKIEYYKCENGGKPRAINFAVKLARHDWFFTVDSDDFLVPSAIEKVQQWIQTVENNEIFAGVAGSCEYISNGSLVGEAPANVEYVDATYNEKKMFRIRGDKADVYKTEILKKFPFPEFPEENFIPEAIVWEKIAHKGYKLRWFSEIIYMRDYLEDGLTKNETELYLNNFRGYTHYYKEHLKFCGFLGKMHTKGRYFTLAKIKGYNFKYAKKELGIKDPRAIIWLQVIAYKIYQKFFRKAYT